MRKFIDFIISDLKKNKKKIKILFTEGWNKNIQKAAIELNNEGIIEPILLMKKKTNNKSISEIKKIIINEINHKKNIDKIIEIRKNKNLKIKENDKLVLEPNYLSALLLKRKIVDGVVCGIEYTTRDTLIPALQIVGKEKNKKLVSSFMAIQLKNDFLIFGDCALNINPTSSELSDIALNIAKMISKILKNQKINVALLSYSTNGSGKGESVEKVIEANKILQNRKIKNIDFYGDIQFDAAINKNIRNKKIKSNKWKTNAKVFIFPNIDSGNIGYKIIEQCVSESYAIGPILIGLEMPMNDLSRGASLRSIKDTAYVTAFQKIK